MEKEYIFNLNQPIYSNLNKDVLKNVDDNTEVKMQTLIFYKVILPDLGKNFEERMKLTKIFNRMVENPEKVEMKSSEREVLLKFLDLAEIGEFFKSQIEYVLMVE